MLNIAVLTILACMSMAMFMLIFNVESATQLIYSQSPTQHPKSRKKLELINEKKTEEPLKCLLPTYDSWDREILDWLEPRLGEKDKCNSNFKIISKLEDRKIISMDKNFDCFGRCISRLSDYKNKEGDFVKLGKPLDCDIVEAHCYPLNSSTACYAMMHTQIIPIEEKKTNKTEFEKHNVFVILVDSMATSQADRNIPKTMHYLEKSMSAVTFPYVNKIGINSRPNGMALWFGKQIEEIERTVYGLKTIKVDMGWKESCDDYLDNLTSIFKDFNDQGYTTFLADDWAQGVLNWPNCYGFDKQPTDHLMQPFQIAVEMKSNELLYGNYTEENCIYQHRDVLRYLNQFIETYKGRPKFAWLWTSLQSHDYESSSVRLDTDLYEFFLNNKGELDKSFVIVMGDHGLRFGSVTKTRLGALDVNNPLLSISVPIELRKTGMLDMMRLNAKKLQTHYDTRATLLDIAKHLPLTGPDNLGPLNDPQEKGESLLRQQKLQDRSCKTLPIPFAYCLCDFQMENITKTSDDALDVGRAVIDHINLKLKRTNSTEQCNTWTFDKVLEISGYYPVKETGAYTVIVAVSEHDQAQFRAIVHRAKDKKFSVGGVDRVDSYGSKGDCVRGELAPICHCKEQKQEKE